MSLNIIDKQTIQLPFQYPPVGEDDWRYAFETARIRALETGMLKDSVFHEMATAETYEQAVSWLAGTEYEAIQGKHLPNAEAVLLEKRTLTRKLFAELMLDESILEIWLAREDFANMKLAVRRFVTGRALGNDYSHDGTVPPAYFQEVFEQENYNLFPDYLQDAVGHAILSYYMNKDIRAIDYAIDKSEFEYFENIFLLGLFRTQIDLINLKTMLRLKWRGSNRHDVFFKGGFVELARYQDGLQAEYEALPILFFTTPYHDIVELGIQYMKSHHSFIRTEQQCESHLVRILKISQYITSGPQPIIAYFLIKEHEIRKIRFLLTGKQHRLDVNLMLDRLGEGV
jgi:V/A-type H+-transporting ATPase subunit C